VYFVSKGTVSFCLSKDYGEKEIKEVKKHNNFGEIEMCLSEKLQYNIKVKSRNCELFVLKKNDFLRLSVNFKDFIEKFLYKSLMIYLRFTNEKKRIMKLIEDSNVHLSNKIKKEKGEGEELERIDEEIENEYDIYNANQSDSEASSNNDVKVDNEEPKKQTSKKDSSSSNSSSSDSSKTEDDKKMTKKTPNIMDSNIVNSNYARMSNGKKEESMDGADVEDSQERTKALNKKFTKKIDKIITFLEKNKNELENFNTTNTLNLLRQLKATDDLMERNETIDRIEQYLSEILKNK
jgi:CRP-like cAMP-binding protein